MAKIKDAMLDEQDARRKEFEEMVDSGFIKEPESLVSVSGIPGPNGIDPGLSANGIRYKAKEPECEYGHVCTGSCQETTECPCVNDHVCSMSDVSLEEAEAIIDEHDHKAQEHGCIPCEVIAKLRRKSKRNTRDNDVNVFFRTAGRDALRGRDMRNSAEISEDDRISPNPFD